MLMDAAMFSEDDYVRGVSEAVMLGQLAPIGGNEFDLYINEDKLHGAKSLIYPHMNVSAYDFRDLDSPGAKEADGQKPGTPTKFSKDQDNMEFARRQTGDSVMNPEFSPDDRGGRAISPFSPMAAMEDEQQMSPYSSPSYSEDPFGKQDGVMSPAGAQSPSYEQSSSGASPLYSADQASAVRGIMGPPGGRPMAAGATSPNYSFQSGSGSPNYTPDSGLDYSPTSPGYSGEDAYHEVYSATSPNYSFQSGQSSGSMSPRYSQVDSGSSKSPVYSVGSDEQAAAASGGPASGPASSAGSGEASVSPALSPGTALSPSGVLLQPFVAVPAPIDTSPSPEEPQDEGIEPAYSGDVLDDLGLGDMPMPGEGTTGEATLPLDSMEPTGETTEGLPESGTPPGTGP